MSFTSIDIKVRPIKIAFLIDYGDKEALRKALFINSILWGGKYNPIIPVYKRLPKNFIDPVMRKFNSSENVTNGYIKSFDADFILNLSSKPDNEFPIDRWHSIKESDIFDNSVRRRKSNGRAEVNYGVGLFEIMDYLEEKEFKFVRADPFPITDLEFGARHSLFFGSVFGIYSQRTRDGLQKRYSKTINIQKQNVSLSNYLDIWQQDDLTTVRMASNSYFDVYGSGGPRQDYIFLMDINSWQDNVDLINLKASGINVFALPVQICMTEQANKLSVDFIEKHHRKYNQNNVYYEATILKSRDCTDQQLKEFADSIKVDHEPMKPKFMVQNWYPRMWDAWARDRDGVAGARLEHKSASHQVEDTNEVRISQLKPDFIEEDYHWWKPKYANEISFETYGADDFMANVFPTDIDRADMVLGRPDPDAWRFSKQGIVYIPSYSYRDIDFKIPYAEDVYRAWQRGRGINAELSTPGKLARQIVKKLGADRLRLLAHEDFAKVLQDLTSAKGTVSSIGFDDLWARIKRFTSDTIWHDADGFLKWILAKKIFELGAKIECTNCGRHPWFSLADLSNRVTCHICLEEIEVGLSDPKKQLKWAYKPTGPFSVPDLAQGSYTVVLALHFFTEVMNMKITPRYSFESKDGTYEADFGVLVKQKWHEGEGNVQLIGECKSFGSNDGRTPQFKNEEFAKLIKLSEKDGSSIIVLATLRRELTPTDKKNIQALVGRLRKARFKDSSTPDVLILTGNELFAHHNLQDEWEKLSPKHQEFSKNTDHTSISELCDLTQQLYLDLESWWDWWDAKRKSLADKPRSKKS